MVRYADANTPYTNGRLQSGTNSATIPICQLQSPNSQLPSLFRWLQISSEMVYTYKGSNVISKVYDPIELYYPLA
jgi:hypothetical protein